MKHVIFFDNGQGYEDNRQSPVCIAPDGNAAAKEVKRLEAWFESMKEKFPNIEGSTMEQDAWIETEDKRREKINRIRCPYGCSEVREGIQYCQGSFFTSAVPDAKT